MNENEETTITNRLALGFEGALTTMITGGILWLCLNWFFFTGNQTIYVPFYIVWLLTISAFILSALTLENHLLKLLSRTWYTFGKTVTKLKITFVNKYHTRQST